MDPLNLNHAHYFPSIKSEGVTHNDKSLGSLSSKNEQVSTSDQVILSPAAVKLYESELPRSRFSSLEQQSASKTKQVNSWITLAELESGVRKPPADEESARLRTLSLLEIVQEINRLPNKDEHGYLQNSFAGTERGDKLSSAKADIILQSQYAYEKASKNVTESLQEFKEYVEAALGVDSDTYSIQFKNGKITVVNIGGGGLPNDDTKKIQALLDEPKPQTEAQQLVDDITDYNEAASTLINNNLLMMTVSGAKNPYLPKEASVNQIMEGMDYSHVETRSHLYGKWVAIVAQANEKYHAALKDGSHLENAYKDTPGLLELTKIREANKGLS